MLMTTAPPVALTVTMTATADLGGRCASMG